MKKYKTKALVALLACLALLSIDHQLAVGQWIDDLPYQARQSILWSADHEEGTLDDWGFYDYLFPGGGVFDTRGTDDVDADVSLLVAHSGVYSARTTIRNAFQSPGDTRAIRLMRWTDRPWERGGFHFPGAAYYSTWIYIPENYYPAKYRRWDPEEIGRWNVLQFETHDDAGVSRPMWGLNIRHDDQTDALSFYLLSEFNTPSTLTQAEPIAIPIGKWVHIEAFYKLSALEEGQIIIWQDGNQILDGQNVRTAISLFDENAIWSIGNQSDHIGGGVVEGSATLYFDDAIVSTQRISSFLLEDRKVEMEPVSRLR